MADEQDMGFLTRPKFYAAMALLSTAQSNGGKISDFEARRVLSGTGGVVPPPFMKGLQERHPSQATSEKPKAASLSFAGYAAPSQSSSAAQSFVQQAPASSSDLQLPLATAQEIDRYHKMFAESDRDGDGYLQANECFGIFMQWNLPQSDLSSIWDVAAGDDGRLNKEQFVNCLYLMESRRKGAQIPTHLPSNFQPAQKPEEDHMSQLSSQVEALLGRMPPPVSAAPKVNGGAHTSQVPELDPSVLNQLPPYEKQRLTTLKNEADEADRKAQGMESKMLSSEERVRFFNQHMQELVLFKSRAETKLLEMDGRVESAQNELAALEKQYQQRYNISQESLKSFTGKVEALNAIQKRKAEVMSAFEFLQMQESSSANIDFEIQNGQNELVTLEAQLKEAEDALKPLLETLSSRVKHRGKLQFELDNARLSQHVAKADIDRETKKIKELQAKLADFSASAGLEFVGSESGSVLQARADEGMSFLRRAKAVSNTTGVNIRYVDESILEGVEEPEDFEDEGCVALVQGQFQPLAEEPSTPGVATNKLSAEMFDDVSSATKPSRQDKEGSGGEQPGDVEESQGDSVSAWEFIAPSDNPGNTFSTQQQEATKSAGTGMAFDGFDGL